MTSRSPTCWIVTEGFAGMENQCLGLAEAIGVTSKIKRVQRPRSPLRYLSPRFWPNPLVTHSGELAPPWPEILISSGRGSVAAALAIRRCGGGSTFAVHIQTPYVDPLRFDLVVIPEHDGLRGENIVVTRTALHRVTKRSLKEAEKVFKERMSHLPRPLIAVLVGGPTKDLECSSVTMRRLADQVVTAASRCGGALAVTASRRTGAQNEMALRQGLEGAPQFFWDGKGDNPYLGILALADAIVVTSDSVSMVSEACATGKPVHVFSFGEEPKKLRRFHKSLMDSGITRPFSGVIEQWSYEPPNDTQRVAAVVREFMS
jgi:mitochondrial fission protein ELM1